MGKKHQGRHLDTGEIDALAIRQLREPLESPIAEYDLTSPNRIGIVQYAVHGTPGQEPQVTQWTMDADEVHSSAHLTGSICGVSLLVNGDGSTILEVHGYHLDETRAQWDIAAATIGGFRINPFPAPAEGTVICVYCGGRLEPARAGEMAGHYLHDDDSPYCGNATGSVAYPVRLVARGSRPNRPAEPTDLPPELNRD